MRLGRRAIALLLVPAMLAGCRSVQAPQANVAAWGTGPHPVGVLVELDGSASRDPQGRTLSYRWILTAKPAGSLARVAGADLAIAALTPDAEGTYGVELVVSNGLLSRTAQATLAAKCGAAAPAIAMGPLPAAPHVGSPVALSATVTDPDAQAPCSVPLQLSYRWRFTATPAGSAASLSGAGGLAPWFVPDLAGTYTAQLTATDGRGHASRATIDVDVGACGSTPPVITPPAAPLAGRIGAPVQLSVTAADPDAEAGCDTAGPLRYRWAFVAVPAGSHAALNDPTVATPSFTPDVAGTYLVRLTVTASNGHSATAEVEVDVTACGGNAPAVTVTASTHGPAVGETVALSATVSDDDVTTCGLAPSFAYAWHLDQLPAGSRARFSDRAAQAPWLVPDQPGDYVVSLVVTASNGQKSAPVRTTITASTCGTNAPQVTIAPPADGSVGLPFALSATETDADTSPTCSLSDSATWSWAFVSLPSGSVARLQHGNSSSPWFTPDVPGDYVVEALATDAAGHVSPSQRVTAHVTECGAHPPEAGAITATPSAPAVLQPVQLTADATDLDITACHLGQTLSYAWTFTGLPAASRATMVDPTGVSASFTPDVPGTYGVQLVVTDSTGRSSVAASTTIDASSCGTASPVPVPSLATTGLNVGQPIALAVSTTDPNSACATESFTYAWSFDALPSGSRAALTGAAGPSPSFTADVAGTYVVRVTATDSSGQTGFATLPVDVTTCGAHPPTVAATTTTASAVTGSPVALSATAADADNDASCGLHQVLSYAWSFDRLPPGSHATFNDSQSLTPSFTPDADGTYVARVVVTDSTGRSAFATVSVDVAACGNASPVPVPSLVTTGSDVGQPIALSVSTTDANSACATETFKYAWSFDAVPTGSRATLTGTNGTSPWFLADVAGTYVVRVTVTDSSGQTGFASLPVDVTPCGAHPPTITATTTTASAVTGSAVGLSATASDPDNDPSCGLSQTLSYSWSFDQLAPGSRATLDHPTSLTPSFTPDVGGTYVARVVVTDSTGRSAFATVSVDVAACGTASPVPAPSLVTTGSDVGQPIALSVSTSDANSACATETFKYAWSFDAVPTGSRATWTGANGTSPWFLADLAGTYVVRVTVTDSSGETGFSTLPVEVTPCGSHPPTITATTTTATPVTGSAVGLSATASDPDNDPSCGLNQALSYSWSFDQLPPGSRATLDHPTSLTPSFTPDVGGTYVARAVVTDPTGRSAFATVSVDVAACGTASPVPVPSLVTTGLDVGQPIALSVSTSDANSACATETFKYAWSFDAVPAGSLAMWIGANGTTPSFTADLPGTYFVRVTVTDSSGRTGFATLPVDVTQCGAQAPRISQATSTTSAPVVGSAVALSVAAADPDNDASCGLSQTLSYAWSFDSLPPGSRAALSDASTAGPSFTPDVAGTYLARVVVTDSTGRSASATVSVDVAACSLGAPRVAVSASSPVIDVGSVVAFEPTVTFPDAAAGCSAAGEPLSYAWQLTARPTGSTGALSSAIASTPLLIPDVAGSYAVQLAVTDAAGQTSAPASLSVAAGSCTPALSVSANPSAPDFGATVSLVGRYTPCAGVPTSGITYAWRLTQAPSGSTAAVASAYQATASLKPDAQGTYAAELAVSDGVGHFTTATASFTTSACGFGTPSAAPSFSGSTSQIGSPIQLAANAADPNGGACGATLSYAWTLSAEPAGSHVMLSSSAAENPSFVPALGGTYAFAVVVTDSFGRSSAPAPVSVTVAPTCTDPAPVALAQMIEPALQATSGPAATTDVINPPLLSCRFQLDARGSTYPSQCAPGVTSDQLGFRWNETAAPPGSTAQLSDRTSATPWIDVDVSRGGTYSFDVYASYDGVTSRTPATVTVEHQGFWIARVNPSVSCGVSSGSLVLTAGGQGFLTDAAGDKPTVVFNGTALSPSTVALSGCAALWGGFQTCSTMTITLSTTYGQGSYPIDVTNPVQDGCTASAQYNVNGPPTLFSVAPTQACSKDDPLRAPQFDFTLQGTNLTATTQYTIDPGSVSPLSVNSVTDYGCGWPYWICQSVDTTMPALASGTYSVNASNGAGCNSTLSNALKVVPVPLAFFVDPPVLYNGISLQATAYLSGLNGGNVKAVYVRPKGASGTGISEAFTYDPSHPDQVQFVVPRGQLAAGEYELMITDVDDCTSLPVTAFQVTSSTSLALSSINPPFGLNTTSTAVDLAASPGSPPPPEGFATTGLPRVYLSPSSGTGTAAALSTVTIASSSLAHAVVKAGLPGSPSGTPYDVIVVNPDGAVGVLKDGFKSVTVAPPVVNALSPESLPSGSAQTAKVFGSGFSTAPANPPAVQLTCVLSGVTSTYSEPVDTTSLSATSFVVNIQAGPATGSVCTVRVTNPNGTYGDFIALGYTGASLNLNAFSPTTTLNIPRRGAAVAAGRATNTARFLYAAGGDDPANPSSSAPTTVERAPLDQYGNLGAWQVVDNIASPGWAMVSAATLGRYIYLAGGETMTTPTPTINNFVKRVIVLDPARAPEINDLLLDFTSGAGLAAGYWYYKVSAVLNASDPDDPNGETLPSDPLVVVIPAGLPKPLQATITWAPVPNAASYNVYRTVNVNDPSGTEQLLANVTAPTTTYTDTGVATSGGSAKVLGDTGNPVSLPALTIPRTNMGFTVAMDPSDSTKAYLYAVGGLTTGSTVDGTYEYLPITIDPATGEQTYGASWTRVAGNTIAPRWEFGLWRVTKEETTYFPSDTDVWLHAGMGFLNSGGTSFEKSLVAAQVQTGGLLSTWTSDAVTGKNLAGYGCAATANQLFTFGGGPTPTTTIYAGELCGVNGAPCSGPPGLHNLNNNGAGITHARYLPGTAVESAHIFLVGGQDTTGGATATTESVVW